MGDLRALSGLHFTLARKPEELSPDQGCQNTIVVTSTTRAAIWRVLPTVETSDDGGGQNTAVNATFVWAARSA